MREDYLKRFRINACLDDVQPKMEHIRLVLVGEAFEVWAG